MSSENHYPRTSILSLKTEYRYDKSALTDCYFTPPFKITRPFYNEKGEMKIIAMSTSAGMLAGDCQEVTLNIGENTNVYYTSQSYEKIHKMEEGMATRKVHMYIGKNACLKYVPLSTIPYAKSAFWNQVDVHLEDATSRLMLVDIISGGRIAHGECFDYRLYKSYTSVRQEEKLIYRDHTHYEPSVCEMKGFGMFEAYTHLANILLVNMGDAKALLEGIRKIVNEKSNLSGGASLSEMGAISIKAFGKTAQQLEELVDAIEALINRNNEQSISGDAEKRLV